MDSQKHQADIKALVDRAYTRIQALFDYYQMEASDFDFFKKESPRLLETIDKIEDSGILSYEDMIGQCHKWIENHHLLFKRRAYFRRI